VDSGALDKSVGLPPDGLHLWRWRLARAVHHQEEAWLTPDERARAARYRFDLPRHRFVAARAGLRRVLSRYLGTEDPCAFPFALGPHGKPALALPEQQWLRFSLAHTDDFALCALSREREVGVDVECIESDRSSALAMAYALGHLCSPAEVRFLAEDSEEGEHRFLTLWTAKEAVGKAQGAGMRPPIPVMDAVLASGLPVLPDAWVQHHAARRWWVARIVPFEGTVGALAVEMREEEPEETGATLTWFDLPQDGT
jgi:4'-phosphopantetheinyl transferase